MGDLNMAFSLRIENSGDSVHPLCLPLVAGVQNFHARMGVDRKEILAI
jgi:hypothetical protein